MNIRNYIKDSIQFIEVTNNSKLKVTFANLGASIFNIVFNRYYMTNNVRNAKDFFNSKIYHGKTIGRISNRMRGHTFKLNGEKYDLEPNEGENVLHGGIKGFSNTLFKQDISNDDSNVYVTYFKEVKDMEDGFPGNLRVEVRYIVSLYEDIINVEYRAYSDKDTVLSMTNHTYFTLGCRGIDGLTLLIPADYYLETYPEDLLARAEKEVTEPLDFRIPKLISKDIDDPSLHGSRLNGYDHYYYFNNKGDNKVVLSNKKIDLEITTNFKGVQIYSSGFKAPVELYPVTKEIHNSIAIEPSDSFEKLHLLKKDTLYFREIKYIFLWKE